MQSHQSQQFSFSWLGVDQTQRTGHPSYWLQGCQPHCQGGPHAAVAASLNGMTIWMIGARASLDRRLRCVLFCPTSTLPPPRARLVDWVRLSIVGARNSRGCAGWARMLLISLPPFFLTFGHRSNTETQCNYVSVYAHDSNGLSSSVCVVMLVGSMSGLVALTSCSVPDLQLVKRMFKCRPKSCNILRIILFFNVCLCFLIYSA